MFFCSFWKWLFSQLCFHVGKLDDKKNNVVSRLSNVAHINVEIRNVDSTLFDVVNSNVEIQFSLLQYENTFLKTEINQKQKTIDKLLDLNWLQSKDQYKVNDDNKTDKKKVEMPQLHNGNSSVNVYNVNKKLSHNSGKPENDNIKMKSSGDSITKIMVVADSLDKYLRREELSSKKNNVKVIKHLGSTTEDMLDYIKPNGENLIP